MRILTVHNRYLIRAGEDIIWQREQNLLEQHGHEIINYTRDNQDVEQLFTFKIGLNSIWSNKDYRALRQLIQKTRPDVMAVHNHFPLISPAAYYAARAEGVGVVQTLHNYRLLCPGATLFRNNQVCEDCVNKTVPWPSIKHGCYRNSRVATAGVAAILSTHHLLGTWQRLVNVYIALNDFAQQKFIDGGLPQERIAVKPNFVYPDPGTGSGSGNYALYVGRLSAEKGIETMLQAWKHIGNSLPLKIAGDGPLSKRVEEFTRENRGIEYLGRKTSDAIFGLMREANFVLVPSEWYEGMPLTIIESFAVGTPVIASNLGSMKSLVQHGSTGLHFRPGDSKDLTSQVQWALLNPTELARMRQQARAEYEEKYTAEKSYQSLIHIYERAISEATKTKGFTLPIRHSEEY